MKYVLALLMVAGVAQAEDYSRATELMFINQSGGVVALTVEPCAIPEAKGFENRSYATEANGTKHEGCWTAPDTSEAPSGADFKIVPIVNVWYDGVITAFPQTMFAPLDKQKGLL
jgi:hypothetical protein